MTSSAFNPFAVLLEERVGPCISLYLPTARKFPDRQQDVVRYRNAVRDAENMLPATLSAAAREALIAPLHELITNERFWQHTQDGMAVMRSSDFFKVFKVQRHLPERVIVSDSFHIKPLLRVMQATDRFEVLAITRDHVRLFHGNRDSLDESELDTDIPRSLTAALGEELTEPHDAVRTVGGGAGRAGAAAMHYGISSKSDEVEKDTERYFRVIDRAILEHHNKHDGVPLVLAALPEYHAVFHAVSHNPRLLPDSIAGNPDVFSADDLRQKAWEIVEPAYTARVDRLINEFGAGVPRGLATDDLNDVAMAAIGGRVASLLVDADQIVPGYVDHATGVVVRGALDDPRTDDVVDDLAEIVLRQGGQVMVVARDRMPSKTGVAAVYRF